MCSLVKQVRELTCEVTVGGKAMRALIDTGASVSLMSFKKYRGLRTKGWLKASDIAISQADGRGMRILGIKWLPVKVGGVDKFQKLYIAPGLCEDVVLGEDWLKECGAQLNFDPAVLTVGGVRVALGDSAGEPLPVILSEDVELPPRMAVSCVGRLGPSRKKRDKEYHIEPARGYKPEEEEVSLCEAVVKGSEVIPLILTNTANKTVKVQRGEEVGRALCVRGVDRVRTDSGIREGEVSPVRREDITVPEEFRDRIERLLRANRLVVANSDRELGQTETVKMKIDTGTHSPIKMRPYRTPIHKRKVVEEAVREMQDAGIVERSRSPWSFPIVVVDKKDGGHRFCVDFRALNAVTKPLAFPLPLIDDLLALLGEAKYFTTLDLRSGYWQVAMNEEDREKAAFTCHMGLYQFRVMPFGLAGAPGVFQQLMSIVLEDMEKFAMAYLDDILVFSKSPEEHFRHLQSVFDRLKKHGLKLKLPKCQFLKEETKYLGFIINKDGVKPDLDKVEVIRAMPEPKTVRQVRGFIGAIGYYRRFIPAFSRIATPLIQLTKKYARFKWTEECQRSFDCLKEQLTAIPLLTYPDLNRPMVLYTDASEQCIGACLTQPCPEKEGPVPGIPEEVPVYFLSHRLSPTQQRWPVIEREAYAIVYALQKLDYYLNGATFTIKTDHRPLQYLFEADWTNKKIQQWALKLNGYNCKIEYLAGKENTCADLLSRIPQQLEAEPIEVSPEVSDKAFQVNVLDSSKLEGRVALEEEEEGPSKLVDPHWTAVIRECQKDPEIEAIRKKIEAGDPSGKFILDDEMVYYVNERGGETNPRLYVPIGLRKEVLEACHEGMGHMGVDKTHDLISRRYFWPGLYGEVNTYVAGCITCQARSSRQDRAPLEEMDVPAYPFEKVSLDISGPYGETQRGNLYIVSFVDWLTNWPEAFAVPDKKAQTVAKLLLSEIFPRYGAPRQLVTDNGPENLNKIMQETVEKLRIKHITTSPYHPQSNAKVERFHRFLGDILAKLTEGNTGEWDIHLNQALAAVRFSINETSRFSPYFMIYGRDVVLPVDNLLRPRRKYMGEEHHRIILENQHKIFTQARRRIKQAQKKRNERVNRERRDVRLAVGDPVFHRIHMREGKLQPRWAPYYRIVEQTSPVSFIIWDQLSGKTRRAHANDLKLAEIDEWEVPEPRERRRRMRRTNLVEPREMETDSESEGAVGYIPINKVEGKSCEKTGGPLVEETNSGGEAPSSEEDSLEDLSSNWEEEEIIPLSQIQKQVRETNEKKSEIPLKQKGLREELVPAPSN